MSAFGNVDPIDSGVGHGGSKHGAHVCDAGWIQGPIVRQGCAKIAGPTATPNVPGCHDLCGEHRVGDIVQGLVGFQAQSGDGLIRDGVESRNQSSQSLIALDSSQGFALDQSREGSHVHAGQIASQRLQLNKAVRESEDFFGA